ncbi:MAG: hypothetical protein JSS20_22535, partial [Proteobacteria bacterium]|nr:hypothetical protein [Pseudomonadota bacterium]
ANPINLLVMLTLLQRLEIAAPALRADQISWTPPPPIGQPLSRMVAPVDMPLHIRRLVNDLGFGDRSQLDVVVPSLLRHLAGAPALLGVMHVLLIPKLTNGSLRAATDALYAEMQSSAAELAKLTSPLPLLASLPATAATMRTFTGNWIPLMTIVGIALRRALQH